MLYIFHGEQFWIREKVLELSKKAQEKGCEIFRMDESSRTSLNSFLARNLFGKKIFLVGEHLLEIPERAQEAKALARDLMQSENVVVLFEYKISEAWEKIFDKAEAKVQEFKKPSPAKLSGWLQAKAKEFGLSLFKMDLDILISDTGPDPFALQNKLERLSLEKSKITAKKSYSAPQNYFNFADAASGKRKYQALSLLRSYVKGGFGAEEAFWKLWWKIKTLRMVDSGKSASWRTSGLHPFVEKKALADLQNYSPGELKKLSCELLDLFSQVRRGEESFEEGLEKLLLKT